MRHAFHQRPALLLLCTCALAVLACQERTLHQVDETQVGRVTIVRGSNVRPVDVLFVVDDSESMCAEQIAMAEALDRFVAELAGLGADLRLAVTTTDMADLVDGNGQMRLSSGTPRCEAAPVPAHCPTLTAERPWLELDAVDAGPDAVERFVAEASCLLQVGRGGSGVEMGLDAARAALERQPTFVRDDALLVIVFVSDDNDCSDGTRGTALGPVYEAAIASGSTAVCEQSRNLEDSCPWTSTNTGPMLTVDAVTRTAFDWCVLGDREALTRLGGAVDPQCAAPECQNLLTPRASLFASLEQRKPPRGRETAPDVLVATLVHPDDGQRSPTTTPSCDPDGQTGYRYTLFAQMWPADRRAIHGLCDAGAVVGEALASTARRAADLVEGVCLPDAPRICAPEARADDGSCLDDTLCCPEGQRCTQGPFAGSGGAFYLCSGFRVDATLTVADGSSVELGPDDIELTPGSPRCPQPYPIELELAAPMPAGGTLVVEYPGRLAHE